MRIMLFILLCVASMVNSQNVTGLGIEIVCAAPSGSGSGSSGKMAGLVHGLDELMPSYNNSDFKVVIYSQTNVWWVQPYANRPLTEIPPNGVWSAYIHLGWHYAAFLVRNDFSPPSTWSSGYNAEWFANYYAEYVVDFDFSEPGVVCGQIQIDCAPHSGAGADSFGPRIAGNVVFDLLPPGYDYDNFEVVIYSHTDYWYIQPYRDNPTNAISEDGSFSVEIHLGDYYSVYLVYSNFSPVATWDAEFDAKWFAVQYSEYVLDFDSSEPGSTECNSENSIQPNNTTTNTNSIQHNTANVKNVSLLCVVIIVIHLLFINYF